MPELTYYIVAGLFLPLFPLSMVFNGLYSKLSHPVARALLLLVWPQLGLWLLLTANGAPPPWFLFWALSTALLYSLRALALRELGLWTCFIATSAWALLWIPLQGTHTATQMQLHGLGFSAPMALLALLGAGLERRFGAAYAGLCGGLAQTIPRFAAVLVIVILAVIATPLFPAFATMLSTIVVAAPMAPLITLGVAAVWLLWSWAGARMLQGLIVGPRGNCEGSDLSLSATWGYAAVLALLLLGGLYGIGTLG